MDGLATTPTRRDHQSTQQLPGQILPSTRIAAGSRRGAKKGSAPPGAVPARPIQKRPPPRPATLPTQAMPATLPTKAMPSMQAAPPTQAPPTERKPQGGRDKLGLGMAMKFGAEIREGRQKQQRDKVLVATKLQALFRGNGGRAVAMEALGASLRRRAARESKAAAVIQTRARGKVARLRVKRVRIDRLCALEGRRTDAAVSMQAWARGSRARVLVASRRTAAKIEQAVPMPGGVVGEIWRVFRGIAGDDCRPGDSAKLVSVADFMKGMNMVATVSVFGMCVFE